MAQPDAKTDAKSPSGSSPRIAIIGAGAAGVCMGIRLKAAGVEGFTIYEKAARIGGTWRDNTYPGLTCDVPSHLYSFSFEPKPDWSRKFGPQSEIEDYLEHCAEKYGLTSHIRFDSEIAAIRYDDEDAVWRLSMAGGEAVEAEILIAGCGQLNRPHLPNMKGLKSFKGVHFHSARWNHEHDLSGRTVAVVGSGASAIQFVPEIAPKVGKLVLFQRSPNWVMPKPDRAYSAREQNRYRRWPWLQRLSRAWQYWSHEWHYVLFRREKSIFASAVKKRVKRRIRKHIEEPELREHLVPDYPVGCKRILLSNDWYPALARDNVEVVPQGAAAIAADGVIAEDGTRHAADTIIFATGFESTSFLAPIEITGRGGRKLSETWKDGAEAHRGVAVPGFPNFFMLYGPNTNLGHNSIIFMIECQANYVLQCVEAIAAGKVRSLDVQTPVAGRFNADLQRDLGRTVWAAGCGNWYTTPSGRITNNWAGFTLRYWWQMRKPDFSEYAPVAGD